MKRKQPKVTPTKPNPNKPTMPELPPAAKGKVAEQIKHALGEENFTYMMGHHGKQKRSRIAKHIGISKYVLNQYYLMLGKGA